MRQDVEGNRFLQSPCCTSDNRAVAVGRNQFGLRQSVKRLSPESAINVDSNRCLTTTELDCPIQTRAVSNNCVSIPTPLRRAPQSSAENRSACVRWYPTRESPTERLQLGGCARRVTPNSTTNSPAPLRAKELRGNDGTIFRTAERTLPGLTYLLLRLPALSRLEVAAR